MNIVYVEYGPKTGKPVLYCHGSPGSRRDILPSMVDVLEPLNIRLIMVERAGHGLSTASPSLSVQDEIRSWLELMDVLDITTFHVLGFSMGSFYALNCAYVLPDRVTGLTLVSSMAPNLFDPLVQQQMMPSAVMVSTAARDNPPAFATMMSGLLHDPQATFNLLKQSSPLVDQAILDQAELSSGVLASLTMGTAGLIRDFSYLTADWGLSLQDIQQPVKLWCGRLDMNTPILMSEYLNAHLPNSQLMELPNQGHWCLYSHWSEILSQI